MATEHDLPTAVPAGKRIPTIGMQLGVEAAGATAAAYVGGASEVHYGPLGDELGPPAVLTNQADGQGRAVYFAIPLGARYLEFGIRDFRNLIADSVAWVAQQRPPIRVSGAGDTLALTAFQQGERTLIHLVNSVRDETRLPINETIPSRKVRIELDREAPARSVCAFGDSAEMTWAQEGRLLTIELSAVDFHVLLVIE